MSTHHERRPRKGSMTDLTPGDLLGVGEAAALVGLKPATLYRMAWSGKLRSFKVCRSLKFYRADLLLLVEERPARP